MNPYVSHITGVFRWLNGDDARNYLKDAVMCRKNNNIAARDFAEYEQERGRSRGMFRSSRLFPCDRQSFKPNGKATRASNSMLVGCSFARLGRILQAKFFP
jgi:hypothetical protein